VLNPHRIDVAAADQSLAIDPVEGGESRTGIIESEEVIWRDEEKAVSHSRLIRISSHRPILIVISKQNRPGRAGRIDRKGQRAIAVARETMIDPCTIGIVTDQLIARVQLVSPAKDRRVRDIDRGDIPAQTDEGLKNPGIAKKRAAKVAVVVYPED
jgi:hypothetical protein